MEPALPDQPGLVALNGRKVWSGQSLDELRELIESDQSVDNPCFLINPQPR